MRQQIPQSYEFEEFRLDAGKRLLSRSGEVVPLMPKAFDILRVLVARHGETVSKDELFEAVWNDTIVEENNLNVNISALRKVFKEKPSEHRFIVTVPGQGYKFVAEVREIIAATNAESVARTVETKESDDPNNLPTAPPEKVKTEKRFARIRQRPTLFLILTAVFLTLIFLTSSLFYRQNPAFFNASRTTRSIAVLPLKPVNTNNRDLIYELGIAESLILKLGAAQGVTVRPLSATRQYSDIEQDALAAGREQQVDYVLASNYQLANGKIRVTSQLINVRSGAIEETLRGEKYSADVFSMQDVIASDFGNSLLARFGKTGNSPAAKRSTINEEAYRLYLTGAALTDKHNRKDAEKAVEYLEQAVRLDPHYALAYARLANAHGIISLFGGDKRKQYLKQKTAIEKALAIDENLSEAHSRLGEVKLNYEWDFEGAERELKKAVRLDANSPDAHRIYGVYLNSMGRFDESIAEFKTAIDLEPASVLNQKNYGMTLYYARRYDEAIAQLLQAIEIDPNFRTLYGWLINSYKMKGEGDQAFEWFLRSPNVAKDNPEKIPLWKEIYAKSGWRGITERQIEEALAEEKNGKPYWDLPRLYADLGDKEQAIASLERTFNVNERGWGWTVIKIDPRHDLIRSDARFEEIVKRVGLK